MAQIGTPFVRIVLAAVVLLGAWAVPARAQTGVERKVYFGEQHVHTSWSFDAFAFGDTVTGPADLYRYARGQPTPHPGGLRREDREAARPGPR